MPINRLSLLLIYIFFTSCATIPNDTQSSSSQKAAVFHAEPNNQAISTTANFTPEKTQYYLVKRGDSLKLIADKFNVDSEKIIEKNHIANPDNLRAGQLLIIPGNNHKYADTNFLWPVKGKIIGFFGEDSGNIKNKGLRIKTNSQAEVKAAQDGEVVFSDYLKGWGKTIILKHTGEFYTVYSNLIDAITKEGISVRKGEVVGKLALNKKNGEDTLYFEIRRGSLPQDPLKYLR